MKKFFALFLIVAIAVTSLVVPAFAEEASAPGGLDFYSLTIHYETPVVVDFKYVTDEDQIVKKDASGNEVKDEEGNPVYLNKAYVWGDARSTYVIGVTEYSIKNEDGDVVTNQHLDYQEAVLKNKKYETLFYAVNAPDLGVNSSKLALNANYGLVDITNNTVIANKASVNVLGPQQFFDDAGTPNPNFTYENGYFLDVNKDADGNNYRIDVNGYVIDANNIWHDGDGRRVEPFVVLENDGKEEYIWIDIASRIADGIVIDYKTISNQSLIDKGILKMPEKYANLADEYDSTVDYDGDGTPGKSKDKVAYKALVKEKENWLSGSDIMLYRIDFQDTNGDGKKTDEDLAAYNSADKTFTEADILVSKTKDGKEMKVPGTPVIGTPISKVKVSKLSVEIDAMGESMPADLASDPQQKNEIIVTIGDLYDNVKAAVDYVAANSSKVYTDGKLVGSAKSVTTKTEMKEETGLPSTVKSIDLTLEEGIEFTPFANFYIQFKVETSQPAAASDFNYIAKKGYNLIAINKSKLDVTTIPDQPKATEAPKQESGCGSLLAGSVAVMAVMAAAVVALKKKED